MGYYLLDNRNPNGDHFHRSRRQDLRVFVVHITAGLEDLSLPDQSAERTARYAATTARQVSWHAGVDTDSIVWLLPDEYTAFHVQGFNSPSYGLEISKRTTNWHSMPDAWVAATLRNAAEVAHKVAMRNGIPFAKITAAQARAGQRGFIGHHELDPSRRSDPGLYNGRNTFPWSQFLRMAASGSPQQKDDDMIYMDTKGDGQAVSAQVLANRALRYRHHRMRLQGVEPHAEELALDDHAGPQTHGRINWLLDHYFADAVSRRNEGTITAGGLALLASIESIERDRIAKIQKEQAQ